jgi:hypothetical protein
MLNLLGTLGLQVEPILILSWFNKSVECCFYTSCYFFMMEMGWTFYCATLEYRPATSRWGVMLQAGFDSRKGSLIRCLLHVIVLQI